MKGQITLEYMVLSLVVLALLAVSISTLIQIQRSSSEALDNVMFRKSGLDLHGTVEEVCALGAGNQRKVYLSRGMSVEGVAGESMTFRNGSIANMSLKMVCPLDITADNYLNGWVTVTNKKDMIEIQ